MVDQPSPPDARDTRISCARRVAGASCPFRALRRELSILSASRNFQIREEGYRSPPLAARLDSVDDRNLSLPLRSRVRAAVPVLSGAKDRLLVPIKTDAFMTSSGPSDLSRSPATRDASLHTRTTFLNTRSGVDRAIRNHAHRCAGNSFHHGLLAARSSTAASDDQSESSATTLRSAPELAAVRS